MSRVPEGWGEQTLGELTKVYDGTHQTPTYVEEGVPFYSVEHVTSNCFEHTKYIAEDKFQQECKRVAVECGDILMSRIGDIGTARHIDWDVRASFYVSLALIKAPVGVDSRYLAYCINGDGFQQELWKRTIHVAFPKKINLGEIGKCPVVLPPLPEQKRIAAILSSVDDAIATTEAVIEQTQRVKEGLLQDLLTRGIGHTRFKQTEIGEIPEGWEVKRLEDLADDSRNSFTIGPFGSNLKMSDYRTEGVPVVFVRDVKANAFKWKSEVYVAHSKATELFAHDVRGGDLVITKMGLPPGIAAVYPLEREAGIITADIIRLRPAVGILSSFLCEVLNSKVVAEQVEKITGGQTRPKLTLRDYKMLLVPWPSRAEQEHILNVLDSNNRMAQAEELKLQGLKQNKRGLMQDLLSGDVRVTV